MIIPKDIIEKHPYLERDTIIIGYRGSVAHGMYIPNSEPDSIDDIDIMAIVIPPIDHYFGLREFGSRGTKEVFEREWDIVTFELRKFIRLLTKGNPNVISMLWLEPNMYLKKTASGEMLITHRNIFLSKGIYHSFVGYARNQLDNMSRGTYRGFMAAKRRALVDKIGYDPKHASHCIRLLRLGIEFLNENVLHVKRYDAEELLQIKRGEWTLEQVKLEADKLFLEAKEAYEKSTLPEECDLEKISNLCVSIIEKHFLASNNQSRRICV